MEWIVFGFLLVGAAAWALMRQRREPPAVPPPVPAPVPQSASDSVTSKKMDEAALRRAQAAADRHGAALVALLAVARADGNISKGETHELHNFLTKVGQRDYQASLIDAARTQYSGSRLHFEAAISQTVDEPDYRSAALKAMELIIERGKLAHPEELALIKRAAEVWGLPEPKFYIPVGTPLK